MKAALTLPFQCKGTLALIGRANGLMYPLSVALLLFAVLPAACQSSLPEFFGIYAVVDGKLAPMIGGRGTFTPSQISMQVYNLQKMSPDTEKVYILEAAEVRFLVFDTAVADTIAGLELYRLPYGRNVITRPDGLAQVGSLLNQVSGRGGPPQNSSSPLEKYVLAKTDALKIELLQKPVPGQPQMVQLVPASNLEAGLYSLFAIRIQGGQPFIVAQLFEVKGQAVSSRFCIDLARTGGFGGAMDESDARLSRPYYMAKEQFVECGASIAGIAPSAEVRTGGGAGDAGIASVVCSNEFVGCVAAARNAAASQDWQSAIRDYRVAANLNPTDMESWMALGRIFVRTSQSDELSKAWDKAISLGGSVLIAGCLEQGRRCERGNLQLSAKSISFVVRQKPVFSASLGEIGADQVPSDLDTAHNAYSFQVAGKRYTFSFFPSGVTCAWNKGWVECPPEGVPQQKMLAGYVSHAVPKLVAVH